MLAQVYPDRRLEAFLSLRSYEGFYASMYSELVRNRGYLPWRDYRAAIEAGQWCWLDTVADLVAAFGAAQVTVWDFADFGRLLPQLVARIGGLPAAEAQAIAAQAAQATRPSLSQAALDALAGVPARERAAADPRALAEAMDARFPVADGHARFRPFDRAAAAALAERYRSDLAEIARRWPTLRILRPDD